MTTPNDKAEKALQEWLEQGAPEGEAPLSDERDVNAYMALFETLNDKPAVAIPLNFSEDIVARLEAKRDRVADFRWNFILPLAVIFFTGLTYAVMLYINKEYADRMLQLFINFKWYVAFIAICFFVIQYFDHRLLRKIHPESEIKSA